MRVEFVADPWLPMSDEEIKHERMMLAGACRQTRTCRCEVPFPVLDRDGHSECLKCAWPIAEGEPGRLHRVVRLIARLMRYPKPALLPQPQ